MISPTPPHTLFCTGVIQQRIMHTLHLATHPAATDLIEGGTRTQKAEGGGCDNIGIHGSAAMSLAEHKAPASSGDNAAMGWKLPAI
jgi:hypothetical protein